MKFSIFLLLAILLNTGCIMQDEAAVSGRFSYPGTGLSLALSGDWFATKISGAAFPLLFTGIDYGIKPNIMLETVSPPTKAQQFTAAYAAGRQAVYPDYTILEETDFQINDQLSALRLKAKRVNSDQTPVIHLSYVVFSPTTTYVFTCTCAEPSFARIGPLFDETMKTLEIESMTSNNGRTDVQ